MLPESRVSFPLTLLQSLVAGPDWLGWMGSTARRLRSITSHRIALVACLPACLAHPVINMRAGLTSGHMAAESGCVCVSKPC